MVKYSKQLVMDYINALDITLYDVTELEDDRDFMMMVIDTCNDKHMFNMCGDKLKGDIEFIRYLIMKFRDDIDYIVEISNEFIEHTDGIGQIELKILLSKYLVNIDSVELLKYRFDLELFYIRQRLVCQNYIEEFGDTNYRNVNSLGFDILLDTYYDKEIIKEYFAKNMLAEIFAFSPSEFEKMLHLRFKNKDKLLNMGINQFLINCVYEQDECLSRYVTVHIDLLSELYQEIVKIIHNWDKYEDKRNKYVMEVIIYELDKFVSENEYFWGKELELYKSIIDRFKITKNVDFNIFDTEFDGTIDNVSDLCLTKLDVASYRKFENFMERISNLYYFDIEPDDYIDETSVNGDKGPCKILKFEPEQ